MRRCLIAMLFLAACGKDETVAGYGAAGQVWTLQELDGARFPARATLSFSQPGRISGETPCNSYVATMTAPYPWFRAEQVAATRMVCPDLRAEAEFLAAIVAMTQSEVLGPVLILRDDAGREMVFRAQ